ncbi:hypothetical protein HH214_07270 [Mucilaginibacter robiniae]|uniref:Aromatic hydrocarbon degradation protein n=1 Tax=Mucilaginibacter robiniae TaxID=2728022 RepID=A0A7L5E4D2_9SPHI|nr:hypothetical protein [Mucilaginibacter robiniae]QJD95683.1 hypothetical protein HH214_07270 [Mucilaginibacter robiniae]
MIKYIRSGLTFLFTVITLGAWAQSTATTSSPYSQFGIGSFIDPVLPQNKAMGGIGTATNRIGQYNTINPLNPASYGAINLTTIDIGISSSILLLKQSGSSTQTNNNTRLSHVAFAVPVTKKSALSFGLLPYTELGYNYKQSISNFGTSSSADTNTVNYIYSGDGSLSKAYAGYGFGIGKHILLGGNVSYIFGNMRQYRSTEIPDLYGTLNSRIERSNAVGGLNYDYGVQLNFDVAEASHLIFGYSGSASTQLNSKITSIVSQYTVSSAGNENIAADTISNQVLNNGKIKLPLMNHFGLSYQKDNKFLIGADYSIGNWNTLTIGGVNQGLQKSQSYALGGSFTPNALALHNYFALVDYRLGVRYDKTYINVNSTDIKQYALTFGMGFPLPRNNTAFYKINFTAELAQRGTLQNSLIKENYINLHLSFTLNDLWFRRYQFD